MKKIIIPFLALWVIACTGPSKTDLQQTNENLVMENAEKDKMMNDLANSLIASYNFV